MIFFLFWLMIEVKSKVIGQMIIKKVMNIKLNLQWQFLILILSQFETSITKETTRVCYTLVMDQNRDKGKASPRHTTEKSPTNETSVTLLPSFDVCFEHEEPQHKL